MNILKLNNLYFTTGIHTCMIQTSQADFEQVNLLSNTAGITVKSQRVSQQTGELVTSIKLNPNTFWGDWVTSPDLFNAIVQKAMLNAGIYEYKITRMDIAFNSYNDNDFDVYAKLNRLLISLLSISKNMFNRYESIDFVALDRLNIKAKSLSGDKEIEAYNKQVESNLKKRQTDITFRLEFRRMKLNKSKSLNDYESIMKDWLQALRNAVVKENIVEVETMLNEKLVELYNNTKKYYASKKSKSDSIRTINRFVMSMQDYIYSKRQLIALYELLGVDKAQYRADDFKRNHYIEFFSQKDLNSYIDIIENTVKSFVNQSKKDAKIIEEL